MTPQEIRQRTDALVESIGSPDAYATVMVNTYRYGRSQGCVSASLYPRGLSHDAITCFAEDFATVIALLETKWNEYRDKHELELTENMALEIIRATNARGSCTDGDLRSAKFATEQIRKFGARACELANVMASNGPFEITVNRGDNTPSEGIVEVRNDADPNAPLRETGAQLLN